jgi:hypothetical protein
MSIMFQRTLLLVAFLTGLLCSRAIACVTPALKEAHARGGLVVMGMEYATLTLTMKNERLRLAQTVCRDAPGEGEEIENASVDLAMATVMLRVEVGDSALCAFSYSADGRAFTAIGKPFMAKPEKWTGAKVGLFCTLLQGEPATGKDHLDVDWFRIEALQSASGVRP